MSDGTHYDFIVVGGGLAGNVVAGRLAENPDARILIVEAGVGDPQSVEDIMVPMLAQSLLKSEHDWTYRTTFVDLPDYQRVENDNSRGKALGGSSSINYFSWTPGCKPTFDAWEDFGGKEWKWDNIVHYLRKAVTYHDDKGLFPEELKKIGLGGPVHIAHGELEERVKPFREALSKAWEEMGEPLTENIYDGEMRGLMHSINTIYKGKRNGSFLFVEGKKNITIMSETYSKSLIIENGEAKGVVVIDKTGKEHSLYAKREVIVSEGVFESPKLLLLSGIGPADELKKFGIEVKLDSPHVGKNLLDHPGMPFVFKVKDGYGMDSVVLHPGPERDAALAQYKKDQTGPINSPLYLDMIGFPRIDSYLEKDPTYREAKAANGGKDPFSPHGQPHFELDFLPLFAQAFQWHYPMPKEGDHLTVNVDLCRPVYEGGQVTLNSTDPKEQPYINLNYFSNELDIICMREGVRFVYDMLLKTQAFKGIIEKQYPWDMPLDSDAEMRHALLERTQTSFHPCGTNRLGKSINQGVVDGNLKVHGIKNLRVVDASIIPVIPDCRPQNSIYMIGEKGADLIKEEHKDLYK